VEVDGAVKSLMFTRGENSSAIAERFCNEHEVPDLECVSDIVDLIKANLPIEGSASQSSPMTQ
jgi:hypothetical protein